MTFLDLHLLLTNPLEIALRQVIVNTRILLAIVEVFKTTLTYLAEGRVKVTFIVDTILIVMLTKVISMCVCRQPKWDNGRKKLRWCSGSVGSCYVVFF